MARRRHTPEQIVGKLREAEVEVARGTPVAQACKATSVTEQTYYRRRKEYGGRELDQAALPGGGGGSLLAADRGWSMGPRIDNRLAVDALEMALAALRPGEGLVAHSGRGSRYASEYYQGLLARHGIACGMSRRANCWDNAPMESFFASLKKKLTHGEIYATREEVRASPFESIEVFFDRVRRHSSLGYLPPGEYERAG